MAKRPFRAEDAFRLKTPSEPALSPDGRRVAFVVSTVDEEADRYRSSIWVAATDGSGAARPFTEGPSDRSPRWSPDGAWLLYISVTDDQPFNAHLRLAPLDGGAPRRLGDLTGPVLQAEWSPDSRLLATVCRVGFPDPEKATAQDRNAGRVVRGLGARLDGVGWHDGRRHLFVVDVGDGTSRQLTRGDFDHFDPSWSPDGSAIVFASDRTARRDDRQLRSDAWVVPSTGGRPRRLTGGKGRVAHPSFSPDGETIAFAGGLDDSWDDDGHVFTIPSDGSSPPKLLAPETDRGVLLAPGAAAPMHWIGNRDLVMLILDRGSFVVHRARMGDRSSHPVVAGDVQVDGLAVPAGGTVAPASRTTIAFTESWPDRPGEVYATRLAAGNPQRITHLNDELVDEVSLCRVERRSVVPPDGTAIEYFTLSPPGRSRRRLPLHLDVHGGPHGSWPSGRFLAMHQSIAAAGYLVVLPNPRGSTSYGQAFTTACTGDWGGADMQDIIACCDQMVELGFADEKRMFVSGASYGGFMAAWIVGHSDRFRAATAVAAVVDMTSMIATDLPEFLCFNMGGTPWERPDEYQKRSPLTYLPAVDTPVQVIHWEGDIRVPVGQGDELYSGLKLLGKDAQLIRYPGGFHIMRTPSQAVDWARRTIAWNEQHEPPSAPTSRPPRVRPSLAL